MLLDPKVELRITCATCTACMRLGSCKDSRHYKVESFSRWFVYIRQSGSREPLHFSKCQSAPEQRINEHFIELAKAVSSTPVHTLTKPVHCVTQILLNRETLHRRTASTRVRPHSRCLTPPDPSHHICADPQQQQTRAQALDSHPYFRRA